jgi:ATP synthase protein I
MADPQDSDAQMRARLDKLSQALETRRGGPQGDPSRGQKAADQGGAVAKGMRAASELVAGIVVGGLIGVGLDHWLGTKPWFTIIFFLLGVAAGFSITIRDAMKPTPPA